MGFFSFFSPHTELRTSCLQGCYALGNVLNFSDKKVAEQTGITLAAAAAAAASSNYTELGTPILSSKNLLGKPFKFVRSTAEIIC